MFEKRYVLRNKRLREHQKKHVKMGLVPIWPKSDKFVKGFNWKWGRFLRGFEMTDLVTLWNLRVVTCVREWSRFFKLNATWNLRIATCVREWIRFLQHNGSWNLRVATRVWERDRFFKLNAFSNLRIATRVDVDHKMSTIKRIDLWSHRAMFGSMHWTPMGRP